MLKRNCLIASIVLACTSTPINALDLSPLVGTVQIQFQPVQSAGKLEGCTLVYRVVGQDHAYRKGDLISLGGNIAIWSNRQHNNIALMLKIGIIDSLDSKATPDLPFFAYLQTPHGTTAKSKVGQNDSGSGHQLFVYQLNEDTMNVYMDILNGEPVTIGFNRKNGGLDVLVPLNLRIADTSVSPDGSIVHRESDEMLQRFAECSNEVFQQVKQQIKGSDRGR